MVPAVSENVVGRPIPATGVWATWVAVGVADEVDCAEEVDWPTGPTLTVKVSSVEDPSGCATVIVWDPASRSEGIV